jgi:hypothetical protein
MKKLMLVLAGATVALAGCGGDDDASIQDQVVSEFSDGLSELGDGFAVDEGCIEDTAGTLSDSDAEAVLDVITNETDVPPELQSIFDAFGECVTVG